VPTQLKADTIAEACPSRQPANGEQLVGATSLEHAIESQYAKKAYDTWVAKASKLGEIYATVGRNAYKPVE
jgi:hypothetical protein